MFCLMSGLPPFVEGVTAKEKLTKKDFVRVLQPTLKKVLQKWKGINLLLVMDTELKNFTAGTWLQDFKIYIGYYLKLNKIAIVTHSKSPELLTDISEFVLSG